MPTKKLTTKEEEIKNQVFVLEIIKRQMENEYVKKMRGEKNKFEETRNKARQYMQVLKKIEEKKKLI